MAGQGPAAESASWGRSARRVDLEEWAAQAYPELRRAMLATVCWPWSLSQPLASLLAWRIRRYQALILDLPAGEVSESHVMIYVGGGRVASQDHQMGITHLREYRGARVTFWDWPAGLGVTPAQRDHLTAENTVHAGEDYGYWDIPALAMWGLTGNDAWLERLGDPKRMTCNERTCDLVRRHLWPEFAQELGECIRAVPHALAAWMAGHGFRHLSVELS